MSKFIPAIWAALVAAPLILIGTDAAGQGAQSGGPQASPPPAAGGGGGGGGGGFGRGGGGGFRGGGFRGGNRFYGGFYGGFGPRFGFYDPWYDPFWGPRYGYGLYGYYPPPTRVIVRDRIPEPGYLPPPDSPPPEQNWYRCDDPQGFYPYVRTCNGPWQSVPVTPPNAPGPPQR